MLGWSVDKILFRERQVRSLDRDEVEFPIPNDNEMLVFKIKLSTSKYVYLRYDYSDVVIKRDGSITVKFLNLNNKLIFKEGSDKNQLDIELKNIKKQINDYIVDLIPKNFPFKNIEYNIDTLPIVSLDNIFDIVLNTSEISKEKTIPLLKWIVNNKFSQFFTCHLDKKKPKHIFLKYNRVDNYENLESMRSYFVKMKQTSLIDREWVKMAAQLFNLSEIESKKTLARLIEMTNSKADLKVKDTADFDRYYCN